MKNRKAQITNHKTQRTDAAFTLIELLMVISIIAILVALLAPAVMSALDSAKDRQVAAEIEGLANAVSDFKGRYKQAPPSAFVLYETAAGWNNTNAVTQRSKRILRTLFGPEFDFTYSSAPTPGQIDINGNGMIDTTPIVLSGDECLVFFLGGIPQRNGTQFSLTGFSRNKRAPFLRSPGGAQQNRFQFFKEWDVSRLADRDGDGMPEYYDILNPPSPGSFRPYLYLSTFPSGVYNIGDVLVANGGPATMTSYYHQGNANTPWKPKGFQIISAGRDRQYGSGGAWNDDNSANLALEDQDNITNFSGGGILQR